MGETIFRKESLKKINSPEELNDYIKVSRPSIWIILAAAIVLLVSVFVWAVFGSLETSVSVKAVTRDDGKIICYMTDVSGISESDKVVVGGCEGKVLSISEKPISYDDSVSDCGGDPYTVYQLGLGEWNYIVELEADGIKGSDEVYTAKIVTENIRPLSFIWG